MNIPASTRHVVNVGHTDISYQKMGTGPDLLFVHGWPLNGNTWRNVVPHFNGYTRYVVDLPGTGESKASVNTPLTVQGHVEAVVRFVDSIGFDDVVLIGQDSGGMICRFVAEQRPDVVSALSLCGTEIPGVHAPLVTLFSTLAKLPGAKSIFKLNLSNRFLARTPLILGGTVYDKSLLDGEFRTQLLDPILADDDALDAMVAMIRAFSRADVDALAQTHPKLAMPTLLVWGEDDPFFPADKARSMLDQFAGHTEFECIPRCKLFVHEEYPQRFAEFTLAFLERASRLTDAAAGGSSDKGTAATHPDRTAGRQTA